MIAVRMEGVSKRFGPVQALRGASLEVEAGEIHALVGENGAGKSSLLRILAGLSPADAGTTWVAERRASAEERLAAVGMVHQHFMLVPTLTVAENLVLGQKGSPWGLVDRATASRKAQDLAARYGLALDPEALVANLGVGQAQRVAIVRALLSGSGLLVLDEPTAVLSPPEVEGLFAMLRRLRDAGTTVILVTHKLGEVMEVARTVTVMRRGETVLRAPVADTTPLSLSRAMVGGDPPPLEGRGRSVPGEPVLRVEDLQAGAVRGVSLQVRAGEVLGIAGVAGNGQTGLMEALAGLLPPTAGTAHLAAEDLLRMTVADRIDRGIGNVPEDRHRRGLVLDMTVEDNLILGRLARFTHRGRMDRARIRAHAVQLLATWDVRPAEPTRLARSLSGGNQQKVVVARELTGSPRLLLLAEPTRGVDLGAVARIHEGILRARDAGAAVLLVSSDLAEILTLSDRVAVMYRGRIAAELPRGSASEDALGPYMTGVKEVA